MLNAAGDRKRRTVVGLGIALLGLVACGRDGEEPEAREDWPCTPATLSTQGGTADPRVFQRYSLAGGSADGRRLAVLYAHIGPSSGAPFVNLIVHEAGRAEFVLHWYRMRWGASPEWRVEADLAELRDQILSEAATALQDAGIVLGQNLPPAVPWCTANGIAYLSGVSPREWRLSVSSEACPAVPGRIGDFFRLCPASGTDEDRCVMQGWAGEWECGTGPVELLDLFSDGRALWVVARREETMLPGLRFVQVRVSGR